MPSLQVFDPAMCCSSGVCGPTVDPKLVRFAADLEWLRKRGTAVDRYNLAQQPSAFAENALVRQALEGEGTGCLPLIVVDGRIVSKGAYPSREALAVFVGLEVPASIFTDAVEELVALGAAVVANCEPCFKFHYDRARKLGVSKEDMARAVVTARAVKDAPARSVLELAERYLAAADVAIVESPAQDAPVVLGSRRKSGSKCC